ncbi:MAG TPA: helix-turn-helix domain-containing protein, partial [Thermoanaerobaculia bacterium]
GGFRQDLYYRLRGGAVELPPLRDRDDDVLAIAEHLLARLAGRLGPGAALPRLAAPAAARLLAHDWPGNVRELENVLAVAATLAAADGGVILPEHLELPAAPAAGGTADDRDGASPYHARVDALRRRLVADALTAAGGVQAEAARRLGLSRQAMGYLVRRLGVE